MSGFATVGEVYDDGLTLIFDGEEEPTEKHYKCNTSVIFNPGDRVRILEDSGTFVVEYVVGVPKKPGSEVHGLPDGGTADQALVKASDEPFDAKWADLHGVPSGGSSGQVLRKKSDNKYDLEWATPSGLPSGGSSGQYLKKTGASADAVAWSGIDGAAPKGGSSGQVLKKASSSDFDMEWDDFSGLPPGGSTGQVLLKDSNVIDYDVKWGTVSGTLPPGGSTGQVLTKSGSSNFSVKWQDVLAKFVANQIDASSTSYGIQLRTTSKYGTPTFQIRVGTSGTWYTLTTE